MKNYKNPRINDVADAAGVSMATVSRALSKPKLVHPKTLKLIQTVVKKLGYVANGRARALSSKKTWTVGAVIPSLENAIFASTTYALQKTLGENGYMLIVACSEYDLDVEIDLVHKFIERGVDGLILVGVSHKPETERLIERFAIPHVFTWAFEKKSNLPLVGFDQREATGKVTRHLLELGHRLFGIISTPLQDNANAQSRLDGVLSVIKGAGLEINPSMILEAPFSYQKGAEGFHLLMSSRRSPTAVICLNDVLAIGALSAAKSLGLKVPEDVSITGCEDLEIAAMVTPALTTVRYPTSEMGLYAARHILSQLGDRDLPFQQILPTQLIVRSSSGPPKG